MNARETAQAFVGYSGLAYSATFTRPRQLTPMRVTEPFAQARPMFIPNAHPLLVPISQHEQMAWLVQNEYVLYFPSMAPFAIKRCKKPVDYWWHVGHALESGKLFEHPGWQEPLNTWFESARLLTPAEIDALPPLDAVRKCVEKQSRFLLCATQFCDGAIYVFAMRVGVWTSDEQTGGLRPVVGK